MKQTVIAAAGLVVLVGAALAPVLAAPTRARTESQDPATDAPFRERVDGFWRWFEGVERRLHRGMFDKQIVELTRDVGARVDAVVPGLSWSFGPGDAPGEHALVLSPSGSRDLRLLTEVWIATAPELEGWVFRAAEPPSDLESVRFGVGDAEIDASLARTAADAPAPGDRLAIGVWHPAYAELDARSTAWLARFLVEETLGEDRTMAWLGEVSPLDAAPEGEGARTLSELQAAAPALAARAGLQDAWAFDAWRDVALDALKRDDFPRSELRSARTCVPWIVKSYHARRGRPRDPLRRTGASYATVRVPGADLAEDLTAAALADIFAERLPAARIVGHARSDEAVYVDLLVLDRARTVEDLQRTVRATECARSADLLRLTRGGPKPVRIR
ncbi:MAG: hypothetical protein AAFP86_05945 [Planctomycetota bacterium]